MSQEPALTREALRQAAERRFAEALEHSGLPDPRDRYRGWLRELRSRDDQGFRKALEYFDRNLVAAVAEPGSDPWREWTAYGMRLAQRLHPGSPVCIDATGRSRPATADAPLEELILHLPSSTRDPALAIRIPASLSEAQQATLELLVGTGGQGGR